MSHYETFRSFDYMTDDYAAMREDFRRDDERAEALYRRAEVTFGLEAEIYATPEPYPAWLLTTAAKKPCPCGLCAGLPALPAMRPPARETHAIAEDLTWCYWCNRPRVECRCHLDPNGIPVGHWSLAVRAEVA